VAPNGDVFIAEANKVEKGVKKVLASSVVGQDDGHVGDSKNDIILLRDINKDGKPDEREVFLSNLHMPFGMLIIGNYFYVANTDAVWRYPYKTGDKHITATGKKIIDLPGEGRHWTRNIVTNADHSKIYVSVGSSSNVAENGIDKEDHRACIIEMNPDGSKQRVYATGLRNPVGMDWAPGTKTLWTVVNERDLLGDELVPDYLTSVQANGFYGWPYSYFGINKDPRIKENEQRNDLVQKAIVPEMQLGSHTSSLGLAFYTKKSFPQKYHNGAFIGQHGSWNRSELSGYKVVFVPFANGKPSALPEDFLTGFIANKDESEVYGKPVGVAVLPDGSLLVADDSSSIIWRVSVQ
jgi:glucose/arabinose dehydrogenase